MKRRIRTVGALGAAGALLLTSIGATAASAAEAEFTIDAYASDGSEQITSMGEFLFDSRKSDAPGNTYDMAYRGTLDMTSIWAEYLSLRAAGTWIVGGESAWQNSRFYGTWEATFAVDPETVSVDETLLTCDAVQTEFAAQNEGTSAGDMLQCDDVAYDAASGSLTIRIALLGANGDPVKGADLDRAAAEPPQVLIPTPPGALFVKQSAFEAGKAFELTKANVSGEMRIDHSVAGGIPVSFDEPGNDVALEMIPTFDTEYSFRSLTEGEELPDTVLAQLPAGEFMLRDGAVVEPAAPTEPNVAVDEDTAWVFRGWDPASTTVAGENLNFVGGWELTESGDEGGGDDDDLFGVTYQFHAANAVGDGPLPDAVLALLPTTDEKFAAGDTVTPVMPSETKVVEVSDDVEAGVRTTTTWDFQGWEPTSVEVTDSDVVFTGTWTKTVTEEPIVVIETFGVSYVFRAADDVDGPLSDAVLALLPTSDDRFESGDTVTPVTLTETQVVETVDDEEANTRTVTTWDFQGWDPSSAEVIDSDITFTGTWEQSVETSALTDDPDGDSTPAGDKKKPLPETGGVGPEMLLAGAALLLVAGSALVLRHLRRQTRNSEQV